MEELGAKIVADPRWFPMRFDIDREHYQFARVAQDVHRAITFLSDIRPVADEIRSVPRVDAAQVAVIQSPLHMILHSGLGGSTLLARALSQPGIVTTLKEPPILTDVITFGLRRRDAEDKRRLLGETVRLLSRPLAPGEGVVIKMSSIGNGLVSAIAQDRPQSQILCLQTPLELMLAALAARGDEGRRGGQRLFTGMRNARMIAAEPAGDRSDLECAALAWLSIQKMMLDAATNFGADRIRSIESEKLIAEPRAGLAAVAAHFRLTLDVEARLASGIFGRHAKTGQPFDAQSRIQRLQATLSQHGGEIGAVVSWARKVADANGIAWDLPYPLFG